MIRGSAGCFGIDTTKPKLGQIEFFDEDIDHANRIVLADPVFQAFRNAREILSRKFKKAGDAFLHRLALKSAVRRTLRGKSHLGPTTDNRRL